MTFSSPSRRAAIDIWQPRHDNGRALQIHLVTPRRDLVVREFLHEGELDFVHVYWSPDETTVGISATGTIDIDLACNVATGGQVPFDTVRKGLAESIRATYHLRPDQDPFQWQLEPEARHGFFKLHPEINVDYHPRR